MCEICQRFGTPVAARLHAAHDPVARAVATERAAPDDSVTDAPAGPGTPLRLGLGQSLGGTLGPGDADWVRLEVRAGESFAVATAGGDGASAIDTLLVLYDRYGNQIDLDDDSGPGLDARLTHRATDTVYFVSVTTFQAHSGASDTAAGDYVVKLVRGDGAGGGGSGGLPLWTNAQIADQLVRGYWEATGEPGRAFDLSVRGGAAGTIHVDLTNLAPESAWFAQEALAVWSAVSGIRFSTAAPPAGTPVGLRFFDDNSGAYSSATVLDGFTANVLINVSRAWIAGDHYSHESYALQSYIHEIGHALGLGHPGAYDLGDGVTITWADHAEFANDSWQSSVMSYFNQSENARIDATRAYLLTPMPADILAVQMLYGRAGTLRTGDTVYGEGSTAGDYYDTLAGRWHKMAFALIDDGGRDTLRVDTTAADQRIRLAPESFSDLGGATGNMTIARGTVIENAISGTGDDRIEGNDAANRLAGGAGDDTIWGAIGGDTLVGGLGHDRLAGDLGPDRLAGRDGNDVLDGGDGTDRLRGGRGIDWITGGPGTDRMRGGADNDTFVFRRGDGADVIADWQAGGDRLDLRTWGLDGIAELTLRAVAEGLLVEFGPGDSVLLAGAVAGDLPVEDILFS